MNVRKILLILLGIFLFALMLAVGAGLYGYTHPSVVKALMEKAVSRATGAAFSVEHLDYSLNPIQIRAKGILFQPVGQGDGFYGEIEDFMADCALKGPFGRKTLVFKTLNINGFKCRVREGAPAVSKDSGSEEASFLSSMPRFFVSFFLFNDFTIESAEMGKGFVAVQWKGQRIEVSGLSGHLNSEHLMDLGGHFLLEAPTEHTLLSIPDFHIETAGAISLADPCIDFTVAFSKGVLSSPQATVNHIRARTSIHYNHREQKTAFSELNLTLEAERLKGLPQTKRAPFEISLNAGGDIDFKNKQARVHDLSLNIKHLLQFDGHLTVGFGQQGGVDVIIGGARVFSQKLLSLLPVGGNVKAINISGPVDFSGTFSGRVKQGRWMFDGNMEGNIKNTPVSYRTKNIRINGLMTAQVALQGPLPHLKLSGNLTGNQVDIKGTGLSIGSAQGTFNFSGTYPHFDITGLSCRIPEITSLTEKKTFSVSDVDIASTKGHINVLEKSLIFPEIRFKSSLLSNILAAFEMDEGRLTLTAKGKETGLIQAASRLQLLPPKWIFEGTDTIEVTATMDGKNTTSFSAKLGLEKFQFKNPRETGVGENISLQAHISGELTPAPSTTLKAAAKVFVNGGEVLMDRFYFDLRENAFSAQCTGRFEENHKRLVLDQLSLEMKNIATAHITGTLTQTEDEYEGELSLRIPDTPLKTPFQRLIQEPFQTEKPALSTASLTGTVGAEMTLKGKRSRWMTTGVCTWKDGSFLYGNTAIALNGIQLSLPVWLTNVTGEGRARKPEGGLTVRSAGFPFLPAQGLNIPIQAVPNGLIMPAATTLTVPGGTVRIGPSKITGLMGSSPAVHTALHFDNLQLEPILSEIWPHAIKGSAGGNLDPIRIADGELRSTGEIKASIFDGLLTLSQVGTHGLFTALPVYRLNARWDHLSLAEMTEGTSFGKIEGILNGYANDLEVSNGQLQRFDLILDTVKTDDVPQKISVKAVDNIARLGGGQSPFAGVAGIFVSLFKEFPYEKIGVHAKLENDIFRINGTIREDGREYLVKRGFFSGVDVINQSKDNRVGFKDMLKRIQRITSSKGGPVIR